MGPSKKKCLTPSEKLNIVKRKRTLSNRAIEDHARQQNLRYIKVKRNNRDLAKTVADLKMQCADWANENISIRAQLQESKEEVLSLQKNGFHHCVNKEINKRLSEYISQITAFCDDSAQSALCMFEKLSALKAYLSNLSKLIVDENGKAKEKEKPLPKKFLHVSPMVHGHVLQKLKISIPKLQQIGPSRNGATNLDLTSIMEQSVLAEVDVTTNNLDHSASSNMNGTIENMDHDVSGNINETNGNINDTNGSIDNNVSGNIDNNVSGNINDTNSNIDNNVSANMNNTNDNIDHSMLVDIDQTLIETSDNMDQPEINGEMENTVFELTDAMQPEPSSDMSLQSPNTSQESERSVGITTAQVCTKANRRSSARMPENPLEGSSQMHLPRNKRSCIKMSPYFNSPVAVGKNIRASRKGNELSDDSPKNVRRSRSRDSMPETPILSRDKNTTLDFSPSDSVVERLKLLEERCSRRSKKRPNSNSSRSGRKKSKKDDDHDHGKNLPPKSILRENVTEDISGDKLTNSNVDGGKSSSHSDLNDVSQSNVDGGKSDLNEVSQSNVDGGKSDLNEVSQSKTLSKKKFTKKCLPHFPKKAIPTPDEDDAEFTFVDFSSLPKKNCNDANLSNLYNMSQMESSTMTIIPYRTTDEKENMYQVDHNVSLKECSIVVEKLPESPEYPHISPLSKNKALNNSDLCISPNLNAEQSEDETSNSRSFKVTKRSSKRSKKHAKKKRELSDPDCNLDNCSPLKNNVDCNAEDDDMNCNNEDKSVNYNIENQGTNYNNKDESINYNTQDENSFVLEEVVQSPKHADVSIVNKDHSLCRLSMNNETGNNSETTVKKSAPKKSNKRGRKKSKRPEPNCNVVAPLKNNADCNAKDDDMNCNNEDESVNYNIENEDINYNNKDESINYNNEDENSIVLEEVVQSPKHADVSILNKDHSLCRLSMNNETGNNSETMVKKSAPKRSNKRGRKKSKRPEPNCNVVAKSKKRFSSYNDKDCNNKEECTIAVEDVVKSPRLADMSVQNKGKCLRRLSITLNDCVKSPIKSSPSISLDLHVLQLDDETSSKVTKRVAKMSKPKHQLSKSGSGLDAKTKKPNFLELHESVSDIHLEEFDDNTASEQMPFLDKSSDCFNKNESNTSKNEDDDKDSKNEDDGKDFKNEDDGKDSKNEDDKYCNKEDDFDGSDNENEGVNCNNEPKDNDCNNDCLEENEDAEIRDETSTTPSPPQRKSRRRAALKVTSLKEPRANKKLRQGGEGGTLSVYTNFVPGKKNKTGKKKP